ncbi:hypothetical protein [Nonomuraea dietziae]|uniref:hypothetical protein n=1 Tax=Nonomuraea dietziae TaxID=65515 RepID=UPI0031D27370
MTVRELHEIGEFADVRSLFDAIWRPDPANPPVTVELMRVFSHAGGYVAGAYEDGELVGACVGLLASGNSLHSHVTGAVPGRGRRPRAEVAPAAVVPGARHRPHHLDLRPAGAPQRLLQHRQARRPPLRVRGELLRPDGRLHQRRRRVRPPGGRVAAQGGGRGAAP